MALAFGVEGYNQFAEWRTGSGVYDLVAFVVEAARNPWTEGFWLTAMLISTLVPTFLHFALLLASPLALVAGSARRTELANALEAYDAAANPEKILNDVGWRLARIQYLAWAGAALVTLLLLVLISGFINLIHQGALADFVAEIAIAAIHLARWLF